MSDNVSDHGNMVNVEQRIMEFDKATKNGRVYPSTNNRGDVNMENKERNNKPTMDDIKNLKEVTKSLDDMLGKIINKSDGSTKENCNHKSCDCDCSNKNNKPDAHEGCGDSSHDKVDDHHIFKALNEFAETLSKSLGAEATVIPISGDEFIDFLNSICEECENRDNCPAAAELGVEDETVEPVKDIVKDLLKETSDSYEELCDEVRHLHVGISIIMHNQNEIMGAVKSIQNASKKRVKKLEKRSRKMKRVIEEQALEIARLKKKLNSME